MSTEPGAVTAPTPAAAPAAPHRAPRIPVKGTFNFRDLGGHRTADGGTIAAGHLFRADGLGRLDSTSHALMREMGIAAVVDLREEREVHFTPDSLGEGLFEYAHVPLLGNRYLPLDPDSADRLVLADHSLPGLYSAMIEGSGRLFVDVITRLAVQESGGSVFHCSAGKDRTGMIAAFVLSLAGVPREDVIADYALTEQYLGEDFLRALVRHDASSGIADRKTMATAAQPEWMHDVLDRLDRDHGSVEGYLVHHGLRDDVTAALRSRLVCAQA